MHICYFPSYPSILFHSLHPKVHIITHIQINQSHMLCILPALPQQYRLNQLCIQVAILGHFPQDTTLLSCGIAEHVRVVNVGDDEGV